MDDLINKIATGLSAFMAELMKLVPAADSPAYLPVLGGLVATLLLLVVLLVARRRRRRLNARANTVFSANITFDDVSAETAADQPPVAMPEAEQPATETAEPKQPAGEAAAINGDKKAKGFTFFKRKAKSKAVDVDVDSVSVEGVDAADINAMTMGEGDDDTFLAGLEQEMLATRQLYLDGMISKEVYVTETRALYDKAQSRMT